SLAPLGETPGPLGGPPRLAGAGSARAPIARLLAASVAFLCLDIFLKWWLAPLWRDWLRPAFGGGRGVGRGGGARGGGGRRRASVAPAARRSNRYFKTVSGIASERTSVSTRTYYRPDATAMPRSSRPFQ